MTNEEARRELERERLRAWYEANRERVLERRRAYREANRERLAEKQRAYRQANPEQERAYREANLDRERERRRAWRDANRDRWAAERSPLGEAVVVDRFTFAELRARDRDLCRICGGPVVEGGPRRLTPTIDHVVPLEAGGLHALTNVRLAHLGCNASQGHRWRAWLRRLGRRES
jgi:hypothetical protein